MYQQSVNRETASELVQDILDTFHKPYSKHIIDRVFLAIEHNQEWRRRYKRLSKIYGSLLNSQIGGLIRQLAGMRNTMQRAKAESSLIKAYTILK